MYTDSTGETKPPVCPQNSTYADTPFVYPGLPNPRCRLQLRSPGKRDTLPGESEIDRLNKYRKLIGSKM